MKDMERDEEPRNQDWRDERQRTKKERFRGVTAERRRGRHGGEREER